MRVTYDFIIFLQTLLYMVGMKNHDTQTAHKDLRPAEKQKSELVVQRTVEAFKEMINPFDLEEKDKLICLSSD